MDATALVMVDIAPRIETEGINKIRAFMRSKAGGFETLWKVAEAIGNYQPHRERPKKSGWSGQNVRLGADGKYRWHWDPRFRP